MIEFKKESIYSKIKRTLSGSSEDQSIQKSKPTHAKPNTFDKSYFVNPKTGNFQFPKYKHDNRFLIKITDETEYDYFDYLDAEERREYELEDFEEDLCCPEVEVESFNSLFEKKSSKHLKPLEQLKNHWPVVEKLITLEDGEFAIFPEHSSLIENLLKNSYLFEQMIISDRDKDAYFSLHKIGELRGACKKEGIKGGKNKQEIITNMIESEKIFCLSKAVIPSPGFMSWFEGLVELYISDIRNNADRFHPLYLEDIWVRTSEDADIPILEEKIQAILESEYWLDRLHY